MVKVRVGGGRGGMHYVRKIVRQRVCVSAASSSHAEAQKHVNSVITSNISNNSNLQVSNSQVKLPWQPQSPASITNDNNNVINNSLCFRRKIMHTVQSHFGFLEKQKAGL